jgi:uncharacterized protein
MTTSIIQLIEQYQLQAHPEGGWYKETYKSKEVIHQNCLPHRFVGSRVFSTAIYFLLEQGNFSAFHRIKSDECWHFYAGQTLEIFVLDELGNLTITKLGNNASQAEVFQFVVPANCWFASRPVANAAYCFVGCTVTPGFDFNDFEMASVNILVQQFPQHAAIIKQLCR